MRGRKVAACADWVYGGRQKYYKTEEELKKMEKPMYVIWLLRLNAG